MSQTDAFLRPVLQVPLNDITKKQLNFCLTEIITETGTLNHPIQLL